MNRIRGHVFYGKLSPVLTPTSVRIRVEREWLQHEIDFVRANYLHMSNREMGVRLQRSRLSVGGMVSRLNLRRP